MTRTGDALPKDFSDGGLAIFRPDEPLVLGNQSPGELVIAVLALVGKPFLESGSKRRSSPALCLSQALFGLAQLVPVGHLLASRKGYECMKAGINAYGSISRMRNALRLSVDAQTEIPPRRPLDDASTFDPALGHVLSVEPHRAYPWDVDARALWRFEGIREGNARQLVALAFESGFLGQFLLAPLPRGIGRIQHAL